jgi:ArsR family transcriptional regulator
MIGDAQQTHPIVLHRLQAVAEETRLAILKLLSEGERCVCELQGELDAAQSRLSFHLKKLKDAGLIEDRRQGRWVYYRLVPEALEEMREMLGELKPPAEPGDVRGRTPCCDPEREECGDPPAWDRTGVLKR